VATAKSDDALVIAMDNGKSQLKSEHHQLLYEPPGEHRVSRSGMPCTGSCL
jgi:hypothetical protein